MRTEIEALKEIRDRISYFCSRTDGKYDPPWAQEVIGIIDDVLITPYRQCKRFGAPFYVEVGTSIVAIRCASNHDVVWRADHSVHGKATVDWAESMCTRMNQEAHKRELSKNTSKNRADFGQLGDAAKLREMLKDIGRLVEQIHFLYSDYPSEIHEIARKVNAALAEPVQNYEVGTAEEQYKRFMNMCNSKDVRQCAECSMRGFTPGCSRDRCFANWAQLPYEAKKGGAK